MRFGIMAMQLDALFLSGAVPQELMAGLTNFDHAALVRGLVDKGFNLIELGGDLGMWLPQSYSPAAIERLAALKSELNLSYTVHLPLWSVEPSTPLQPVRKGSAQAMIDVIRATLPLRPERYVLHATGALASEFYQMRLPDTAKAVLLRQFQANAAASIQMILQETGIYPRFLAVETIEFPFDMTLELAEKLDLSMCLDTGHVLAGFAGEVDLFDVLELCLPRLGEIHLHDSAWQGKGKRRKIQYGKDHAPLGTASLDVPRLLNRLAEVNYTGPIIFELTVPQALQSLEYIRTLPPQA